jgi:hypothetical protein
MPKTIAASMKHDVVITRDTMEAVEGSSHGVAGAENMMGGEGERRDDVGYRTNPS